MCVIAKYLPTFFTYLILCACIPFVCILINSVAFDVKKLLDRHDSLVLQVLRSSEILNPSDLC